MNSRFLIFRILRICSLTNPQGSVHGSKKKEKEKVGKDQDCQGTLFHGVAIISLMEIMVKGTGSSLGNQRENPANNEHKPAFYRVFSFSCFFIVFGGLDMPKGL